jgi:DNA-binding YbaB/EbfC family protein
MKSFGDLMKQAQKVQKQMTELQGKLAEERYEASSGGGAVKVVVDGKQILKSLTISPELLKDGDATIIEDLVMTAVGEAQKTSADRMAEAYGKLTGGMGLPF